MTKYRIVTKNGLYRVQIRYGLWWRFIFDEYGDVEEFGNIDEARGRMKRMIRDEKTEIAYQEKIKDFEKNWKVVE